MQHRALFIGIADGHLHHHGGLRCCGGGRLRGAAVLGRGHHIGIVVQFLQRLGAGHAVHFQRVKVLETLHRLLGVLAENAVRLAGQIPQLNQAALHHAHVFAPVADGEDHPGGIDGHGCRGRRRHHHRRRNDGGRDIGRCRFLGRSRHKVDGLGRHGRHLLDGG